MQNFTLFQSSDYVSDAPAHLNNNFKSVASDFKGSSFPTTDLFEGMTCLRADESKLYRLAPDLKTWVYEYSIVAGGISVASATNATNATNAVNAVNSQTAVTAGSAEKSMQDGDGNNIVETYVSQKTVGNEANKIPVYNSEGHLVLPSGIELW